MISVNRAGDEQVWEAATGRLIQDQAPLADTDRAQSHEHSARWEVELDWDISSVLHLREAGREGLVGTIRILQLEDALACGSLIVLGGDGGLFAIEVDAEHVTTSSKPYVQLANRPHGRIVPRPLDTTRLQPTHQQLERLFGEGVVHRLAPADIPADVSDPATRDFLTSTGFPAVSRYYTLNMHTVDLSQGGLQDVATRFPDVRPAITVPESHYALGTWINGLLCLDGKTGRVVLVTSVLGPDRSHPEITMVGSSLESFTVMLGVYWSHMPVYKQKGCDSDHVLEEIQHWLAAIDAPAASSRAWQHVLDDYYWDIM
ncbi:SUKH-4 family immunity protein [Streptomyces sp. MST-110588]|uniref:SUKH-4 family immunity protein n=1 Tax=Streptomyces sp. MST-110588 TaxID=2833628 RepID=UPI001F5CD681|nr:SUKH-4 family immunity protein [Streptomyces sp. MST-110588]UNO41909.1 SUKH-4 family immunity protein [Streptomyces sp. MST-110588]